ncbi:hypothetical protein MBLNU459_g2837t1 [Dothideomycetes sp. NU459]
MAKGHCQYEITSPASEFRDFYDFGPAFAEQVETIATQDGSSAAATATQHFVRMDETSILLPSGKVVSNRDWAPQRHLRRNVTDATSTASGPVDVMSDPSVVSERPFADDRNLAPIRGSEKRKITLSNQLTQLSATDRASLSHMTPAEQRSQLRVQKQHVDQERRAQRQMESRLQRSGNKTRMKHFVPDVPGRLNG